MSEKPLHVGLQEQELNHSDSSRFVCDICNRKFKRKFVLQNHKETHLEKGLACDVCKKCFSSARKLETHGIIHLDAGPFPCTKCDRAFKRTILLKRHLSSHQEKTISDKYFCQMCNGSFNHAKSLKSHTINFHCDERPFSCLPCGNTFKNENALKHHSQYKHEGKDKTTKVICCHCNKVFSD